MNKYKVTYLIFLSLICFSFVKKKKKTYTYFSLPFNTCNSLRYITNFDKDSAYFNIYRNGNYLYTGAYIIIDSIKKETIVVLDSTYSIIEKTTTMIDTIKNTFTFISKISGSNKLGKEKDIINCLETFISRRENHKILNTRNLTNNDSMLVLNFEMDRSMSGLDHYCVSDIQCCFLKKEKIPLWIKSLTNGYLLRTDSLGLVE